MPVTTHSDAGVATIEFSTPAHNSLPAAELRALVEALDAAGADDDVRAVVLRSGGDRTFCAGASFDELIAVGDDEAAGHEFFMGFARVVDAIRRCRVPVIGRVQGKAVGGGVGLACACSLTYATPHASVKLSELAIGIGPFVIGPAVERKVGTAAFAEMALRADEWFDAAYAKTRGLYTEVLPDAAALDAAVAERARTFAGWHDAAVRELKRVLWSGTEHWPELLSERARISGTLVTKPWTRSKLAELKR